MNLLHVNVIRGGMQAILYNLRIERVRLKWANKSR